MRGHLAVATTEIAAPPQRVWQVLLDPQSVRKYMFGSDVVTDWRPGSPILFRGEWEGRPYEDKGVIVEVNEPVLLQFTHYSPLSGAPDIPASYHTLTYQLEPIHLGTRVTLTQDNNDSEAAADHSADMWRQVLDSVKAIVER